MSILNEMSTIPNEECNKIIDHSDEKSINKCEDSKVSVWNQHFETFDNFEQKLDNHEQNVLGYQSQQVN